MTKTQRQKIKIQKITTGVKQCKISEEPNQPPSTPSTGQAILDDKIHPKLLGMWPKLKLKIPPIFLHKPTALTQHIKKVLHMGIKFYPVHLGSNYAKITCQTNNDHKHLIQYLEKKQLPFHTFGNPSKRKMKVVIRGIPKDTDLIKIKEALKSVSIPIIRVHKMHLKEERKDNTMLVLAVVPYNDEGKVILKLKKLLGYDVLLEPPVQKPRQCYRCQKWGHSQRYCHGPVKCVKCAGDHLSKKCDRMPEEGPPKCANCSADHTANYKKCIFFPDSEGHQKVQAIKGKTPVRIPLQIVTMENLNLNFDDISAAEAM